MINTLLTLLNKHKEVSDYEVSITQTKSSQLFYILDKLETNRITNNKDIYVTVYHDFEEYRGSSNFILNAADDEQTIEAKIHLAINTAKKVKNPKFELVNPSDEKMVEVESIKTDNLNSVAIKCADAIMSANHYREGWINSVEIFVTNKSNRFINSKGVDLYFEKNSLEVEIIPTWKGENEEIELYLDFKTIELDYEDIKNRTDRILKEAKLRAEAQNISEEMPNVPVVMSGDMLKMLMWNLVDDVSYNNVYIKSNHYNKGDQIVDYPLDLKLLPYYKGAVSSAPYDGSGIVLKEYQVMENGMFINYWGDNRFGQYLGIKNISGVMNVLKVSTKNTIDDILPSLEILNFSSPQLDSSTGYFGGEVRLGIYKDINGNVTPVTGFSVSGNIYEAIKEAKYSKEEIVLTSYVGPKSIFFPNLKIN